MTPFQRLGLFLGPACFLAMLLLPAPPGMSAEAARAAAVALWMAIWWITEAIPLPATALLPLVVMPLLGMLPAERVAAGYANSVIFLFLGGFLLALGLERSGLHRRIALSLISWVGTSPRRVVLGFMVATGFLSMWVSNTATAMMMLPTGIAVIGQLAAPGDEPDDGFATALMLGIAYAASIGGIATLVGTPPNIVLAGAARDLLALEVSFASWMLLGLPFAVVGIGLTWAYLTRRLPKQAMADAGATVRDELAALGRMDQAEWLTAIVFSLVATAWIVQPWLIKPVMPGVSDTVIALAGAIALFLLPSGRPEAPFLLDWETARTVPWGILLLFGGGLALAEAVQATGLSGWLGQSLGGLAGLPPLLVVLGVVALVIFLTEITSNTATATMLMPVMAALGQGTGVAPFMLMAAAAIAASCAFMLPVATPPNAIVYGSGRVTIRQMARAGLWLNLGGVALVSVVVYLLVPLLWR